MKPSTLAALLALAGALLLLGLVGTAACDSSTMGDPSTMRASSTEGASAVTAQTFPYDVDRAELAKNPPDYFKNIEAGMTYDEVVNVMGFDGREAKDVPHSAGTVVYQWDSGGELVTVVFENGHAVSRHFIRAG
jgi:hypothetical protein